MKQILTMIVIGFLCFAALATLAREVRGWDSVVGPLHQLMAYDALYNTGWSDSDKVEIAKYACYEGHIAEYYHRVNDSVHAYQMELHKYHVGDRAAECKCFEQGKYGGAEEGAYHYIELARTSYTIGNMAEALKWLGYAIHFIQDSFCPPHVFPFSERLGDTAAWQFEANTANFYGTIWNNWQSQVTNAPAESIANAEELRRKIVEAVYNDVEMKFQPPKCSYVRQDGTIIGDLSGTIWGWKMSENDIGLCMERAASLVKGAASWVISGSIAIMDFENGVDQAPIRSTIPGMTFTTTMGYDWVYGDKRTGLYNVNPYNDRSYECHGNFFAWLGPNQGSGRIDFTGATAKSISMLTSTGSGIYLGAYDSSGILLASDYAGPNTNTRTMAETKVTGSNIAYIIVHDTGNYWLIDDLRVQDLLRETQALQPPGSSSVFQTLDTINQGETSVYEFTIDRQQTLNLFLNWAGSRFGIQFISPNGTIFAEVESDDPPIRITVPNAEIGKWTAIVTALETSYDDYPFALDVASVDNAPPTATLTIGSPKHVDILGNIYVSSSTPFTLSAEDNVGGSGVATTGYRICNATYDSEWASFAHPIEFHLTELVDGTYSIDYNSTDLAGNVESTNIATLILDNTPPTTNLTIGKPNYVSDATYVTVDASFTLEATDTGSGVKSTAYRIYNAVGYDSGWRVYFGSFNLSSLNDGNYTIAYNSTDNVGNVEPSKTVNVTLVRAKWLKQDALSQLNSLMPTGNKKVDGKIMEASGKIKQSLGTTPWIDENHPNPKYGKQVFDKEKEAVQKLMEILRGTDATQTVKNKIKAVIDELVLADKEIALIAIFGAKAKGSTDCRVIHETKEAQEEYSEALKAITKGNYDRAVEEFGQAWMRAQHAMQKAFGDVNADGKVDGKDQALIKLAWGSSLYKPKWNPAADLNDDGRIDMKDLGLWALNFGNAYN